jgi:hypothetical protein
LAGNRDRNFTRAKVVRRRAQLEESVARYLSQLDTADRQEPSETLALKTTRLKEKTAGYPVNTDLSLHPRQVIPQARLAISGFGT